MVTTNDLGGQNHISYMTFGGHLSIDASIKKIITKKALIQL